MNNSVKEAQEMLFFQSLDSGRGREGKHLMGAMGWGDSHTGEEEEEVFSGPLVTIMHFLSFFSLFPLQSHPSLSREIERICTRDNR